jgi:hypothetical protein
VEDAARKSNEDKVIKEQTMKTFLTLAVLAVITLPASAAQLTCAGHLMAGTKGYLGIDGCGKDESLDLSDVPQASRKLIAKVCGMPQSKGMEGPFCRIEATTVENNDNLKAVKILRVSK